MFLVKENNKATTFKTAIYSPYKYIQKMLTNKQLQQSRIYSIEKSIKTNN